MSDELNQPTPDTQPSNPQQPTVQSPSAGTLNTENHVPQSRFSEVIKERNALQEQINALLQAQKDKQDKELAEQNRFKELYEQRDSAFKELEAKFKAAQSENERHLATLRATNEARLQRIAEDKRHLIPEFEGAEAHLKLSAWLDKSEGWLMEAPKPQPPKLDGGSGGIQRPSETDKLTPAEVAMAKAFGMSVDDYIKYKNMSPNVLDNAPFGDKKT